MAGEDIKMDKTLVVPAREIPLPRFVSDEARAVVAQGITPRPPFPALDDADGWRAYAAEANVVLAAMLSAAATVHPCREEAIDLSSAQLHRLAPPRIDPRFDDCALLYLHGGGYLIGGGRIAVDWPKPIADLAGITTYTVDYRMPPDHPFPAAIDDALDAYRHVLASHRPERIVVMGISAGGGLGAALLLKARDERLPMPAGFIAHSPEVDLTESGDSFATNAGVDQSLVSLIDWNLLYAGGEKLEHPYLSPLFGDLAGFPPTILTCGTRDLFLSNTVLFHRKLRKAGCDARLHVWEAMSHGGFFDQAPEDREMRDEYLAFLREVLVKRKP